MKAVYTTTLALGLLAGNGWAQEITGDTAETTVWSTPRADFAPASTDGEFYNRINMVMPLPSNRAAARVSASLEDRLEQRMAEQFDAKSPEREGLANTR